MAVLTSICRGSDWIRTNVQKVVNLVKRRIGCRPISDAKLPFDSALNLRPVVPLESFNESRSEVNLASARVSGVKDSIALALAVSPLRFVGDRCDS
jgi:hypothetical protein